MGSTVKQLLSALLWDIYSKKQAETSKSSRNLRRLHQLEDITDIAMDLRQNMKSLKRQNVPTLIDTVAILNVKVILMGYCLEQALVQRERSKHQQEILCGFVDAILHIQFVLSSTLSRSN
ncbi:uncharacterized protein LOC119676362 [Teleopsis dalmanni]|uniref:uncharacterized protein LOC119676362 n=1 Tax=Teleopsis dalmanni TaxID=139649 RepID=UPI0018CDCA50|nr:uncharacterized protein LOC119676362 [Teleopsis dalmanni]